MSDQRIRALERAVAEGMAGRDSLEREYVRSGLGWHGESMPVGLGVVPGERGVYAWFPPVDHPPGDPRAFRMQMVYVPAGEIACSQCVDLGYSAGVIRVGSVERMVCPDCNGAGRRRVGPLYVGRYPVTWREWWACVAAHPGPLPGGWSRRNAGDITRDRFDNYPVTRVAHTDALAFCEWSGTRLPTPDEWRHAALRPAKPCDCVMPYRAGDGPREKRLVDAINRQMADLCRECKGTLRKPVDRYPWGNAQPTPEHCIWSEHPVYRGSALVQRGEQRRRGSPAPVVVSQVVRDCLDPGALQQFGYDPSKFSLVPARPDGASWCGAQDMCGNVWEWTSDPYKIFGGSFRTPIDGGIAQPGIATTALGGVSSGAESDEDIGFRVALSAVSS